MRTKLSGLAPLALLLASSAQAQDLDELDSRLELHGFVTQGLVLSIDNAYLNNPSLEPSFELTEVGFNSAVELGDSLSAGLQLFTRRFGDFGDASVQVDWAYLEYRRLDELIARAGRIKIPYGLYNTVRDVDSARVSVLLPQSVYPETQRQLSNSLDGFLLRGYLDMSEATALNYAVYVGVFDVVNDFDTIQLDVDLVTGGNVEFEAIIPGLRLGGSYQFVRSNFEFNADVGGTPVRFGVEEPAHNFGGYAEYRRDGLVIAAEYHRSRAERDVPSSDSIGFEVPGDANSLREEKYYGAVSYQLTPWLGLGAYYSVFYSDYRDRDGSERGLGFLAHERDLTLSARFDITNYLYVKLEGHAIDGGAGVVLQQFGRQAGVVSPETLGDVEENWSLFFLRSGVSF